ncbi:hypothetical protein EDD63_10638 [Breznakia blatticola]|uniref:AAA domain-containing protein n=1 Tax=Breznakia blatticola TaxID=1754012 RepID=A0A4R8A3D8_9FIRM|nr:ATP-binding protein [Breznakia blatticola]TDW25097.1 hypothetical protein EDD63_10638 [Breznakia blatticola]
MIKRPIYLNWLIQSKDNEFVKVITGVRRSGKSVLLSLYKDFLIETGINTKNIIYLNFEHPDNFKFNDSTLLYEYLQEAVSNRKGKIYFMFDEIQEVHNWQKLVNGLRVAFDSDIYITGSNANLLSGELATYLAGRYIELQVYPFSFKEFKQYHDILNQNSAIDIDHLFNEYLEWGGFAMLQSIQDKTIKSDILDGIYTSIILKDVAARDQIREISLLERLVNYLLDVIGSKVSIKKIADTLNSEGLKTSSNIIDKYIKLLKDSFVFYEAQRYDIRGKQRLKTQAKYYIVDTGLRNNSLKRVGNLGSQLENIIYIELKRRGYEVFVGKLDDSEVDFVCFKDGLVEYYQVAYQLPQNDTREQKSLLHIADNYKKTIITLNRMDTGIVDGIPVIHAIDWLLNN